VAAPSATSGSAGAGGVGGATAGATWSGVGNFLGVQNQSLQLGLGLTAVGWAATLTLVLLPVLLFVTGIVITRRLRVSHTVFTFALGYALDSVVTLNIVLALPQTAIYAT
jgi:hypothetical protein